MFHSGSLVPFTIIGDCSTDKRMPFNLPKIVQAPQADRWLAYFLLDQTARTPWELSAKVREAIMSNGPTASNSLGLIGVELYRLHVSSVSATNFVFAAVQTDWRYLAWYSFVVPPKKWTRKIV